MYKLPKRLMIFGVFEEQAVISYDNNTKQLFDLKTEEIILTDIETQISKL